MLRLFKIIYQMAVEVKIRLAGIIALAVSFLLTSFGKDNDKHNYHISEITGHSITFDISHLESSQYKNTVEIYFKPSSSILISKIKIKVGSYKDELAGDLKTEFSANQWFMMGGYEGVMPGQEWTFTFYGNEIKSNRKFRTTTNYVVNQ